MPAWQWFPRGILTRTAGLGVPITTGPTTGTDLGVGTVHTLITSSDGGYYKIDPPSPVGITVGVVRAGTTATTSYFLPDATGVHIHTSSGSTGGRLITVSGGAAFTLVAQTTASWLVLDQRGNVACTTST